MIGCCVQIKWVNQWGECLNLHNPAHIRFHNLLFVFDLSGGDDDDEWEDADEEDKEQDYDSEGGLSEDGEGGRREFMFADCETKSRFTEYSLTSSVMRRNEQLTLLDDRFERVSRQILVVPVYIERKFIFSIGTHYNTEKIISPHLKCHSQV